MGAKTRARSLRRLPEDIEVQARPVLAAVPQPASMQEAAPSSRNSQFSCALQPRRFVRIPTHAVGVLPENREYPRATLKLPLRLRSVNKIPEDFPVTLVTRDISSTGVYFLCPKPLAIAAALEIEIVLVSRPMGHGNVVLATAAQVQRCEAAAMPGWYGIAASFNDVQFDRDDRVPTRFLTP